MNEILILYASQSGNVESYAFKCRDGITDRLKASKHDNDQSQQEGQVKLTVMKLDDFLQDELIPWTPIVVLLMSSFGSGGAPSGGIRFRRLCNKWINDYADSNGNNRKILQGLQFAVCGFGDSYFETFMKNPRIITEAIQLVGGKILEPRGCIDGKSEKEQQNKIFDQWVDNIWLALKERIGTISLSTDQLQKMKLETINSKRS